MVVGQSSDQISFSITRGSRSRALTPERGGGELRAARRRAAQSGAELSPDGCRARRRRAQGSSDQRRRKGARKGRGSHPTVVGESSDQIRSAQRRGGRAAERKEKREDRKSGRGGAGGGPRSRGCRLSSRWAHEGHSSHPEWVGESSVADFVAGPILGAFLQRVALSLCVGVPPREGRVYLACSPGCGCGPDVPPVLSPEHYVVLWMSRLSKAKCAICAFWWFCSLYHGQLFLFLLVPIC